MDIQYGDGLANGSVFYDAGKHTCFFFQTFRYFDNFQCNDRMISVCSNLLKSKSTNFRSANIWLLRTFAVNVDLKVPYKRLDYELEISILMIECFRRGTIRLIVSSRKFDVLKTNICPTSETYARQHETT